MIQRRDRANGYLWDYDTEERQSERVPVGLLYTGETELANIWWIMIQRRDRANGYLWDYDIEERQSERVPLGL